MKRLILISGIAALYALSACSSSNPSGPSGTVTCQPGDPVCPPASLALGFTGPTGAPTIVPANATTTISVSNPSFSFSGTSNSTTDGYWFIVVGNNLRAWGQLGLTAGAFNGDIPLFCGAQAVMYSFSNGNGRSYWRANVTLTACTVAGFRAQLTWDTGPANSDIDLHLIRPTGSVNDAASDCYYSNCTPSDPALDWGAAGAAGNPSLDVDNTDGFGPENITLSGPETGDYTIVVRNFDGVANTRATVKVYYNDVEQQRWTSVVLTPGTNDYWQVAKINIVTGTITPVDTYSSAAPFSPFAALKHPKR
jgi:hypothetical protein